jgi:membrane protease YdiL (CAAX protease family)
LTDTRRCSACTQKNGESARFCRRCGAGLGDSHALTDAGSANPAQIAEGEPGGSLPPRSVEDPQGVFRELCWLCGLVIAISSSYAIYVRVWGLHPCAEAVAVGAVALLALAAALRNIQLVRSSLGVPRLRGVLETVLVAVVAAPTLMLGFWVLGLLGFGVYTGYVVPYERDGWPIWSCFALTAVVTPLSEELLFRGLIQPKLEQLVSPTEALIVQAALFAALHLNPIILVTHFAMGLAFGWLRRRTGSLFPGILLHGAWNTWVLVSAFA